MRINNNLMAMNTHRQLGINQGNGSKSIEKLSSGLRINRAGDDAAGLAISEKMRSQIRGLNQASRNSQDGISLVQTAEGALQESQAILQRMRELAVQSSNDTNTGEDRGQIQEEMNQLTSEINRIGSTTEFNKQKLLRGVTTEVVATDQAVTTATTGEAGVATGAAGALNTTANSVVSVDSTTSVQASTSEATGTVEATAEVTASVEGAKSQVTLANGMKFSSADVAVDLDDREIEIVQGTGNNTASSVSYDATGDGKYTFTVGTNGAGDSLAANRGELFNELDASIQASVDADVAKLSLESPANTAEVVSDVAASGTLAGSVAEVAGSYTVEVSEAFDEAGDTVNVGGETFTAVQGRAAVAADGEFRVDNTVALTGTDDVGATSNVSAGGAVAVLNTGTLTSGAFGAGETADLTFNGVTINITETGVDDDGAAGATVAGATVTLNAADALTDQIDTIVSSFAAVKALGGANNPLADFTIAKNVGNDGFTITSTSSTDAYNSGTGSEVMASTGANAITFTNNAVGQVTTQGESALHANTTVSFDVEGDTFTISKADLEADLDGANTSADLATLAGKAVNADGVLLADAATISTSGNKLVVTSKDTGASSEIKFDINEGQAGDVAVLARAFGSADGDTANQAAAQADSLALAIDANTNLADRFEAATAASGTITLTETAGQATGTKLADSTVAGAGTNDKLNITNTGGQNLSKVTIVQSEAETAVAAASDKSGGAATIQLTSGSTGVDLNNVSVSYAVTESAGAPALTASWDEDTNTLTVSGTLNTAAADTVNSDALNLAVKDGLVAAGFDSTAATVTSTDSGDINVSAAAVNGQTVTFGKSGDADSVVGKNTTVADTLSVEQNNGELTIRLAATTASKNSAENIQAAIQALGDTGYTKGIDFSNFEVTSEGNWDTETIGNSITSSTGTLVGGTEEVKGSYNFDVDTAFAAGDIVEIKGQTFTAVDSGAKASAGEFNVSAGDTVAQAAGIADAISLNDTLKADYTSSASGSTITLTEKAATGVDLQADELAVKATGTAGEFSVEVSQLADGAAIVIDGQEIAVSGQNEHVGYADGTAVMAAESDADQTAAVAEAINLNAELNTKYTASVDDGKLVLTQKAGEESDTAPVIATKNSDIGDFSAKLQIGANTDQSMTVSVGDMRASGLDIAGDGSQETIAATNGKVASYTETAVVTDGETEDKTQFALDISTAEKATAAISVLDDAINTVSTQRAKLGALQNRLEHTIKNLDTSSENLQAAESRIRDVDMAKEMMNFTKNNILQQAAQSMLAQANQAPQGVLQLLR